MSTGKYSGISYGILRKKQLHHRYLEKYIIQVLLQFQIIYYGFPCLNLYGNVYCVVPGEFYFFEIGSYSTQSG